MKKILLLLPVLLLSACITINMEMKPGTTTKKSHNDVNGVKMKPSTESLNFIDPADGYTYKWVKVRVYPNYQDEVLITPRITHRLYDTLVKLRPVPITQTGSFKDERDGQVYKTVTIGKQTWMAQNLNFKTASGCYAYNNDQTSRDKYGLYYDCMNHAALASACPKGWHIPSDAEWQQLEINAGMSKEEAKEEDYRSNIAAEFLPGGPLGFNVLYAGLRSMGQFKQMDEAGYFWTSTQPAAPVGMRMFKEGNNSIYRNQFGIAYGMNIRCVKDEAPDSFKDERDGQVYKTVTIGKQTWMAQNLNFKTTSGCYAYNDDQTSRDKYGLYYDYPALKDACPKGWHIPSDAEWQQLETTVGMSANEAVKENDRGSIGNAFLPNGSTGFNVLLAGRHNPGKSANMNQAAFFWTSTQSGASVYIRMFKERHNDIYRGAMRTIFGMNVRCVKDDKTTGPK